MRYDILRIRDSKLFWKLKEEAPKRKMTIIEAVEDAIKIWLKNKP